MDAQTKSGWCYLRSRFLPTSEDAVVITRNEEIFARKANTGDDTFVSGKRSVNVFIGEVPQRDQFMGSEGDKGLRRGVCGVGEPVCHGSNVRRRCGCQYHPGSGLAGGRKAVKEIDDRILTRESHHHHSAQAQSSARAFAARHRVNQIVHPSRPVAFRNPGLDFSIILRDIVATP
jgi:hypothetical protein